MNKKIPITYVIFGASGDLAKRYLLPAIKNLQAEKEINTLVPISRKDYVNLKDLVKGPGGKIFHLAIPPEAVAGGIQLISENFGQENKKQVKIILEKPFGRDLESAQKLIEHINKYFSEEQIYRVDHYLAKKSLQKIVSEKWEKNGIEKIEIIASEKIDIEGRVNFYEQTGALKDFVQSHLLEMVAVLLSGSFEATHRYEALKNLRIICDLSKHECVKRGQYEGYRQEVGNESMTETFVAINLVSKDPVWHGVSIMLSTGKALSEKFTEIVIKYKNGSQKVFKIEHEPDTYERVMLDVIGGRRDLFVSSGEILETWRILEAIQQTWKNSKGDLFIYKKGSTVAEVMNAR